MARSWIKSVFGKPARRPAGRFAPGVSELEGRDVPATFYVDPNATLATPTYNAGRPDAHTGPFETGVDGSVYASLTNAIGAANALAGPDTIKLAASNGIFFVDSPLNTPVQITDSVDFVGSGAGASVIQTDPLNNQSGAVLLATGAGVVVNFADVTFYGGADAFDLTGTGTVLPPNSITGVFVKYEAGATGEVDRAVFRGIYADGAGGFGAAVSGATSSLTIRDSTFASIGRVGAAADAGATLNLFGNTYSGKGATPYLDYFGQYTDGATGVVSGNTVTGNEGITLGGESSAALLVSQGGGAAASVTAFGNTFTGNVYGVIVGDNPADPSTATLSYNNIYGNLVGVGANPGTGPAIDATHVWWGTPTGPFNPTTNPTGTGNDVADRVTFAPVATAPNPVQAADSLAAYLAATTTVSVALVANPAEPGTAGTVRFTRTGGDTTQPLTVNYTVGGTATPGTDYTATGLAGTTGTVTFAANATTADVTITPVDDTLVEGPETIVVTAAAGTTYTVSGTGNAVTATLSDNDTTPAVTVATVANAAEPGTAGTFRFTRTGDTSQPLVVSYTVGGTATPGTDYATLSGTVTLPAGSATADVPFTPIDDTTQEPAETVVVTIAAGGGGYTGVGNTTTGVIVDDDAPTAPAAAVVTVTATANAAEPGTNGNFRFTRTGGDTTQPLTVTYTVGGTATPGADYAALSGTVTFAANQTTADVPVAVIDDTTQEPTETVVLTIAAGAGYTSSAGGNAATLSVLDNDAPTPPTSPEVRLVGYREFAAGADNGGQPVASLYNPDASLRFTQTVFPGGATGGVRVAAGDVNGDGVADLIVGTGPGVPAQVRVIDGVSGAVLAVLTPFGDFTGGVYVAAGDLTGDGLADVVVTPDEGGGPRVVVYTAAGFFPVASFFGIDDPNFRGGARAALADLNGDGRVDLVVAAGFGGGPRVAFFDGTTVAANAPAKLTNDIFVFEQTLRNGVFVAAGDLDGDGHADLIVGGGPGGGPRVLGLSGADLLAGSPTPAVLANFFAGDPDNRGGVHVAVKNLDDDTKADLVVGPGTGGGDRVFAYLGKSFSLGQAPGAFAFDAFAGFPGGVFVG